MACAFRRCRRTPWRECSKAGPCAFPNQLCLKFGQGSKNPEHQAPIGRRRINLHPRTSDNFESDLPLLEIVYDADEMFQVPP